MKKRLLSIFLACIMIFPTIPLAFASDSPTVDKCSSTMFASGDNFKLTYKATATYTVNGRQVTKSDTEMYFNSLDDLLAFLAYISKEGKYVRNFNQKVTDPEFIVDTSVPYSIVIPLQNTSGSAVNGTVSKRVVI